GARTKKMNFSPEGKKADSRLKMEVSLDSHGSDRRAAKQIAPWQEGGPGRAGRQSPVCGGVVDCAHGRTVARSARMIRQVVFSLETLPAMALRGTFKVVWRLYPQTRISNTRSLIEQS